MNNQQTGDQNTMFQAIKAVHVMYAAQQIAILNAMKERFGSEVSEVAAQANARHLCQPYLTQFGEKRTLDELIRILWQPLRQRGYTFSIEQSATEVRVTCSACPFAALYRQLGGAEWGFHLYCAADAYFVEQFNPAIIFTRTKTLMEGHECCNHCYALPG